MSHMVAKAGAPSTAPNVRKRNGNAADDDGNAADGDGTATPDAKRVRVVGKQTPGAVVVRRQRPTRIAQSEGRIPTAQSASAGAA